MSAVVCRADSGRWLFHCPGCGSAHFFDSRWTFNGDVEKPTFRASLLIHHAMHARHAEDGTVETFERPRCHSFVTDGNIEFLADSTHALSGKTVPLPPWSDVP